MIRDTFMMFYDMTWRWEDFCGPGGLHPWNPQTRDMGYCFQRLFLLIPTLFFLAIVSAYYVGKQANWVARGKLQEFVINFRCFIILCLTSLPLIKVYRILEDDSKHAMPVDYFTAGTASITWLVHFGFALALRQRLGLSPRGPIVVVVLWSLTAVLSIVSLRSVILLKQSFVLEIGVLILQIIYALTLLPSEGITSSTYYSPCLVGSQHSQIRETEPLLSGFTEEDGFLGTAMLGASPLSKLLFHWVNPLFLRGIERKLKDADDLFDLPIDLSCSIISNKVNKALIGNVDKYQPTIQENERTRARADYGSTGESSSHSTLPKVVVLRPKKKYNVTLLRALHTCFGFEFYAIGFLKLFADLSGFAGPLLLNKLVNYIEDNTIDIRMGYLYAGGLLASALIGAFCDSHFNMLIAIVSLKLRGAIITTVFRKTLSVTSSELNKKFSVGEVTNLMSTDTDRILNSCPSFHAVWSIPLQLVVTLYLLYTQVGMAFLSGVIFSIILIPINKCVANKIGTLSTDLMHHKDGRVSLMTEIIRGIKAIKLHVWEDHFLTKVSGIRSKEIKYLKGRKYLDAICVFLWATTPVMVSALTLSTYAIMGNPLNSATVFTTIALLNMLISPLNAFPWVLNGLTEAWVSVKRIQRLLDLQDIVEDHYYTENNTTENENNIVLSMKNASFRWAKASLQKLKPADKNEPATRREGKRRSVTKYTNIQRRDSSVEASVIDDMETSPEQPFMISNITFNIKRGDFIGIIGIVGSGKSSLLSAILAEMVKTEGEICTSESSSGFGYVSQKPWLQRGSIRENILFGKAFEESKYRIVVEACGLTEDLAILGSGTCVGEGGSTLSGGQAARIALARAVYQDKQVYLLDDILSAVDPKVGAHIYKKCIMGLLKYRTRIFVTHSLQYLSHSDKVFLMYNGRIQHEGTVSSVWSRMCENDYDYDLSHFVSDFEYIEDLESSNNITPKSSTLDTIHLTDDFSTNSMMEEEISSTGSLDFWVIAMYWKSVGSWLAFATLLSLVVMQISRNTTDLWLSYWISDTMPSNTTNLTILDVIPKTNIDTTTMEPQITQNNTASITDLIMNMTSEIIHDMFDKITGNSDQNNNLRLSKQTSSVAGNQVTVFLSIYAGFALTNALFTLLRAFLFAYGGICAAIAIHKTLLKVIIQGKLVFFNITPAGRLLNRFSSDTYTVDDSLPFIMNILLAQVFGVIGSVIVTAYGLPWVCLVIVPLIPIYHWLQHRYRLSSREIKRIYSVTLSPIYSHFNDTLEGATIIRALGRSSRWLGGGDHLVERSQRASLSGTAAAQWLGLRLRLMGAAVLAGAAAVAVAQRNLDIVDSGLVGLSISYALSLTSLLSGVINAFTETEREMIAVERIGEYINQIEPEGNNETTEDPVPPPYGWPNMGIVSFHEVVMKYRPHLSPSLKSVTFKCIPGEKIGVVGRTGAGKSSLFASMFRLCKLYSGRITIDSVDISQLSLATLRSRLAIIPQEPFVFTGSIRENLDPLEQYNDTELWIAAEKCGVKQIIRQRGLQADASDLSRGHMQLLCLTRAILQNAKILCIDEATANVDPQTDRIIKETIRCSFRKSTVITIAHRISTIFDSDRVIVMGDGQILEFDTPENLMANSDSYFYQLVHEEKTD